MPKLPRRMYRRGRTYYARFKENGKDVRRSLSSNYEEAVDKFRAITQGTRPLASSRTRTQEAMERWFETGVAAARIPSGRRDVEARIRRYALPFLGERILAEMRPDDLLEFRVTMEKARLRPTLVRRVLSDVRAFFRWAAFDARLIPEPPIPRRLLPSLQQEFPDRLSEGEIKKVSSIPDPYGFVVRLALATGLRWGELTRVQVAHVQRGILHVSHTKSGKTRKVPLSPQILAEIRGRVGRLVLFKHPGEFARRVKKLSGVERFHMHLTRHTFACRWVEVGGNLAVLQAILGHSSVLVTQRYGRLSDDAVVAEAMRVAGESGTKTGTGALHKRAASVSKFPHYIEVTR